MTDLFQTYSILNCTPSLICLFHRPSMDDEKSTFPPVEGLAALRRKTIIRHSRSEKLPLFQIEFPVLHPYNENKPGKTSEKGAHLWSIQANTTSSTI